MTNETEETPEQRAQHRKEMDEYLAHIHAKQEAEDRRWRRMWENASPDATLIAEIIQSATNDLIEAIGQLRDELTTAIEKRGGIRHEDQD